MAAVEEGSGRHVPPRVAGLVQAIPLRPFELLPVVALRIRRPTVAPVNAPVQPVGHRGEAERGAMRVKGFRSAQCSQ